MPKENSNFRKAFTLIELLVVISIVSILASIMFGSQYSIREQNALFQDQYKIMDYINQAKSLTLGAFQRDSSVCGYGVSFDGTSQNVILYKDKKEILPDPLTNNPGTDCNSNLHYHEYNSGTDEQISSFYLNKTDKFGFSDVESVVFNAPSLAVYLMKQNGSVSSDSITVNLHPISRDDSDTSSDLRVSINQFGQVSTQ